MFSNSFRKFAIMFDALLMIVGGGAVFLMDGFEVRAVGLVICRFEEPLIEDVEPFIERAWLLLDPGRGGLSSTP